MPKPTKGPRLGGTPTHQRIILANLASQLFEHGRITTTEAKAKRVRPLAEQLITKAKRGDLHNRRQVLRTITDKSVVHVLFTEIAPTFEDREGGYLRITKVGNRKGDNAPMAVIELVTETVSQGRKNRGVTEAPKAKAKASAAAASTLVEEPAPADLKEGHKRAPKITDTANPDEVKTIDEADASAAADSDSDSDSDSDASAQYGEGSFVGEEPPAGYDIKGNADSMKFHTPSSPWYGRTVAEVWFNSEEAAEKAGFVNAVADKSDSDEMVDPK